MSWTKLLVKDWRFVTKMLLVSAGFTWYFSGYQSGASRAGEQGQVQERHGADVQQRGHVRVGGRRHVWQRLEGTADAWHAPGRTPGAARDDDGASANVARLSNAWKSTFLHQNQHKVGWTSLPTKLNIFIFFTKLNKSPFNNAKITGILFFPVTVSNIIFWIINFK